MSINQHIITKKLVVGGIGEDDLTLSLQGTDGILFPLGTTAQRPTGDSLIRGVIRYNSTLNSPEWYDGMLWHQPFYTFEQIQDIVATLVVDSSSVDFIYDDDGNSASLEVKNTYIQGLFDGNNGLTYEEGEGVVRLGGDLIRNTSIHSDYYQMTFVGRMIQGYPFIFEQYQSFGNSTGVVAFLHENNNGNSTRLGINYTDTPLRTIEQGGFITGYMDDRIGYWFGTNGTGQIAQPQGRLYAQQRENKSVGLFFHTSDNDFTDGLTIYAIEANPDSSTGIGTKHVGMYDRKVAIFHTNQDIQFPNYPNTRDDGTPVNLLGTDANGNLKSYPVGSVGGGEGGSDGNDYVDGISFNTSTGILTLTRTGALADLTQDLDGRWALSSHTHVVSEISDFPSLHDVATSGDYNDLINTPSFSGVDTLAAIGSSPNANAATISGTTLNLEPASTSFGGVVTTGTQSFAGVKTFLNSGGYVTIGDIGSSIGGISFQSTISSSVYNLMGGATYVAINAPSGFVARRINGSNVGLDYASYSANMNSTYFGGNVTPAARVHIAAGTASLPSLMITEGVALTSPVDGAMEHYSDNLYFTIGSTRHQLTNAGIKNAANTWSAANTFSTLSGTGTRVATLTSTGELSVLANGTDTHVLTLVSGVPTWAAPSGGGGVTPAALTKTDDTNVTLTLGGTPTTALLQATSITVGWTGTLSMARGGTGKALSDPGAMSVLGYNDFTNEMEFWGLGSGLSISGGDLILVKSHQTLTSAASVTWDVTLGYHAHVTAAHNITLTITNAAVGDRGVLTFTQDGSGGKTLTGATSAYKNPDGGGTSVDVDLTAGATTLIEWYYDSNNFYFARAKGY